MTTLSSSAPSSSRSSRMSGEASSPSTPGRLRAVTRRSSSSIREPIAIGRSPTPNAPRAGWSAATIISRPSPRTVSRLTLAFAARKIAAGSLTRISVISANRSRIVLGSAVPVGTVNVSVIVDLLQKCFHLGRCRHRAGALAPGGDDGPGCVGEAQDGLQIPAGQQPVAQGTAESVAGTETIDDVDRGRRHLERDVLRHTQNTPRALFDDGDLDSGFQQRLGGAHGFCFADGDLALFLVTDGDRDVGERFAHLCAGLRRVLPEHRSVVEIQDRQWPAGARLPGGEMR